MAVVSASNRSGSTRSVALDIRDFDKIWHASLLHKLKSPGLSGQIFVLIFILAFLSNRQLPLAMAGKPSQEYPVNTKVPQGSIQGSRSYTFPTRH